MSEETAIECPEIEYTDAEFDLAHYPLEDCHKKVIGQIHRRFEKRTVRHWKYQASMRGRIFTLELPGNLTGMPIRFSLEDLQFLIGLPGFRWFESGEKYITFGFEHKF